jgi:hypothetical protein
VSSRPSLITTVKSWSAATSTAAVAAQNAGVGLVYALLMELVLTPTLVGGLRTTPVWPANGFALAAAWLLGVRVLPGIGIAAGLVLLQQAGPVSRSSG